MHPRQVRIFTSLTVDRLDSNSQTEPGNCWMDRMKCCTDIHDHQNVKSKAATVTLTLFLTGFSFRNWRKPWELIKGEAKRHWSPSGGRLQYSSCVLPLNVSRLDLCQTTNCNYTWNTFRDGFCHFVMLTSVQVFVSLISRLITAAQVLASRSSFIQDISVLYLHSEKKWRRVFQM